MLSVGIENISDSTKFFTREEINSELVEHYTDLLENQIKLPPIDVYEDPLTKTYIILNGFHTYHAALRAGVKTIDVEISDNHTELDLFVEGVKKNSTHGHPLSPKDKRRIIKRILSNETGNKWSNQIIATIAGTSDRTVANVKKDRPSAKFSGIEIINCFRGGKPHTVTINHELKKASTDKKALDDKNLFLAENTIETTHNKFFIDPVDLVLPIDDSVKARTSDQADDDVSEDKKLLTITSMKVLQQKCLCYTRIFEAINDGNESINSAFLKKLKILAADLKLQTEIIVKCINEITGSHD